LRHSVFSIPWKNIENQNATSSKVWKFYKIIGGKIIPATAVFQGSEKEEV